MSVPPLRLYNNFETFFSGEVIIHASAVIAPGVIMQAAANSKIIIGSGVCIGMGSILQVDTGTLEIESGANLGSGFLMVGAGKIGANACIGSATTVFNSSVKPGEVVPPGSIVGDSSRSFSELSPQGMNGKVHQPQLSIVEEAEIAQKTEESEAAQETEETEETEESEESEAAQETDESEESEAAQATEETEESEESEAVQANEETEEEISFHASKFTDNSTYTTPPVTPSPRPYFSPSPISYFSPVQDSTEETVSSENSAEESLESTEEATNANSNGVRNHIYGRSNIKSLLITLFPHRQSLDTPADDESQEG